MNSSIVKYQSTKRLDQRLKAVHIHQFPDASEIACSTVSISVIDHDTDKVTGLLTLLTMAFYNFLRYRAGVGGFLSHATENNVKKII